MNKGVTDLNMELKRQKLDQTDAGNIRASLRHKLSRNACSLRRDLRTLTDFRLLFHAAEKYEAGKKISVYLQQYTMYNASEHHVYGIFQTLPLET